MPNIKNIIIFIAITIAFILIYIFFIRPSPEPDSLVSSGLNSALPNIDGTVPITNTIDNNSLITQDFLELFSNIKNIKLDIAIFSDPAFISLHDSSITLIPDGNEGRPNPFAQFGNDDIAPPLPSPPVIPILNEP